MSTRSALDLLPAVRLYVLKGAASGRTLITLGRCAFYVCPPSLMVPVHNEKKNPRSLPRRFASFHGSPRIREAKPTRRGHVQRCLSELAKSGLMWERQRPESVTHEPHDKVFHIRISKEQALLELEKMGEKPWPVPYEKSPYWTKSLKVEK